MLNINSHQQCTCGWNTPSSAGPINGIVPNINRTLLQPAAESVGAAPERPRSLALSWLLSLLLGPLEAAADVSAAPEPSAAAVSNAEAVARDQLVWMPTARFEHCAVALNVWVIRQAATGVLCAACLITQHDVLRHTDNVTPDLWQDAWTGEYDWRLLS
jgi:hypothetical protein